MNEKPLYVGEKVPVILRSPTFRTIREMTEWVLRNNEQKEMMLNVEMIVGEKKSKT